MISRKIKRKKTHQDNDEKRHAKRLKECWLYAKSQREKKRDGRGHGHGRRREMKLRLIPGLPFGARRFIFDLLEARETIRKKTPKIFDEKLIHISKRYSPFL